LSSPSAMATERSVRRPRAISACGPKV
jgi:hypothetical protein